MSSKRAFTLIELLVVVAIIAVLIAMLLPALSKARESARAVVCSSNLQQLGMAFRSYADDHRDRLPFLALAHNPWYGMPGAYTYYTNLLIGNKYTPPVDRWVRPDSGSFTYPAGIWQCPSVPYSDMDPDPGSWPPGTTGQGAGYGVNEFHLIRFALSPSGAPLEPQVPPVSQIGRASELLLISDCRMYWYPTNGWKTSLVVDCPVCYPWDLIGGDPWGSPKQVPGRHNERGNICFVDGHVESRDHIALKTNKGNLFAHPLTSGGLPEW